MPEAEPAARVSKIWQHLADDHGVTVTYGTLRVYVVQRRADLLPPGVGGRDAQDPPLRLLIGTASGVTRPGFAVMLRFREIEGRFPGRSAAPVRPCAVGTCRPGNLHVLSC